MIAMPEALAIMSLSGIVIAAIITRKSSQLITAASCAACKKDIETKFSEKRSEAEKIFGELKKHGEQLARIETRLDGMAPPRK